MAVVERLDPRMGDGRLRENVAYLLGAALIGVNPELRIAPDENMRLNVGEFRRWRAAIARIAEVALQDDSPEIRQRVEETIDLHEERLASVELASSLIVAMAAGVRSEREAALVEARDKEIRQDGNEGRG